LSDLNMKVELGGLERTTSAYAALLATTGFRLARTVDLRSDFYAVEARRA